MAVLVLGSINVDLVLRGERLPAPGETVVGGQFFRALGGKGANQAVAAARFSRERVAFVAAVGADEFGQAALDALAAEHLEMQYVRVLEGEATGVALILVDRGGENLISVASGANARLSPQEVDALPDDFWRRHRVFLASLEVPLATVQRGLERAKSFGLTTIVNPAPAAPRLAEQLDFLLIDLLTPNAGEAAHLTGIQVVDPASAAHAARRIQSLGAAQVVVTLGREGALLVDHEAQHMPAYRVEAIDATAAGDAFNGILAAALAEGQSLADAAQSASAGAAISVTRSGAQPSLPTRAEIETLRRRA